MCFDIIFFIFILSYESGYDITHREIYQTYNFNISIITWIVYIKNIISSIYLHKKTHFIENDIKKIIHKMDIFKLLFKKPFNIKIIHFLSFQKYFFK